MSDSLNGFKVVRFNKTVLEDLEKVAAQIGITSSDLVRVGTHQILNDAKKGVIKLCPMSGKEAA